MCFYYRDGDWPGIYSFTWFEVLTGVVGFSEINLSMLASTHADSYKVSAALGGLN